MGNLPLKLACTSGRSRRKTATSRVINRRNSSDTAMSRDFANTRKSRSMGGGRLNRNRVWERGSS